MFNLPEDADRSIARVRVEPGVTTQLHSLRAGQSAGVAGPLDVGPHSRRCLAAPYNNGKSDLVFLCICAPRFAPDVYANLGEMNV